MSILIRLQDSQKKKSEHEGTSRSNATCKRYRANMSTNPLAIAVLKAIEHKNPKERSTRNIR